MLRFYGLLLCVLLPARVQEVIVATLMHWDSRLAASVVSTTPTATTYSLGCPSGEGFTCLDYSKGIPTVTVVAGPSTAAATTIIEGTLTVIVTCKITATAPYDGPCFRSDRSGRLTVTTTFGAHAAREILRFMPITVTGGLDKIQAATTGIGGGSEGAYPCASLLAVCPNRGRVLLGAQT